MFGCLNYLIAGKSQDNKLLAKLVGKRVHLGVIPRKWEKIPNKTKISHSVFHCTSFISILFRNYRSRFVSHDANLVVVPHKEATFWMRTTFPLNMSICNSEAGKPPHANVFADKS